MALSISAEDRIYLRSQWRLNRRRFALFLLACLVVHVAILAFLVLMQDRLTIVEPEVIPIEIVQEPDQPQDEPKPEEQKPEEQKEEEEKEPEWEPHGPLRQHFQPQQRPHKGSRLNQPAVVALRLRNASGP